MGVYVYVYLVWLGMGFGGDECVLERFIFFCFRVCG